jgi:hypothetical protein
MTNKKRLLTFAATSAFGLGLIATASIAGPIMLGPVPMPVHTAPVVHTVPVKAQMLNAYRQLRTFWISKAIVR